MTRGPYSKGIAKRRQIIEIASAAVAELEFKDVSLREIARRAGMSQTSMIHYFPNKETLFVEVLRQRDQAGYDAEVGEDILGHMVIGFARALDARGLIHLFNALSAEAVDPGHPAHEFIRTRYDFLCARLTGALKQKQSSGLIEKNLSSEKLARLIVATMDGLQMQWLVNPDFDPADTFAYLWQIFQVTSSPRLDGGTSENTASVEY